MREKEFDSFAGNVGNKKTVFLGHFKTACPKTEIPFFLVS
jgi:hypothetical protein